MCRHRGDHTGVDHHEQLSEVYILNSACFIPIKRKKNRKSLTITIGFERILFKTQHMLTVQSYEFHYI